LSKRSLIIRPGGIGDCILALPALEHVTAEAEYTEIWVPRAVAPLIRFGHWVRAISSTGIDLLGIADLPPDPALIEHLSSFDRIVSWYGANRAEFRARVPAEFHPALPPPDFRGFAADFFLQQVGAAPGSLPRISVPAAQRRDTLVIHPFSGGRAKNWPLDRFRAAAAASSSAVEWCAGAEEELDGAIRFENLFDLAVWLGGAAVYLGNDSGITHLAAAVGIPTLAVFTVSDPQVWAPRGSHVDVLLSPSVEDVSRRLAPLQSASSGRSACERR
jgi:heptosyltransferase-3